MFHAPILGLKVTFAQGLRVTYNPSTFAGVEATALRQAFARRMHEVCDELGIAPGRGRQTLLGKRFGVTPKAARKWLEGVGYPDLDMAVRIAQEAGVHVNWLLQGAGPKHVDRARNDTAERIGDIVESLPADERQQTLDFIRYKLERSGQWYAADTVGRYLAFIDKIRRANK